MSENLSGAKARFMDAIPEKDLWTGVRQARLPTQSGDIIYFEVTDPEELLTRQDVTDAYAVDEYLPYWAFLWPVGRALAHEVLARTWPPGATAVEVGCGLGVTGLAAAAAGLSVTMTDYDASALQLVARAAELNGFYNVETMLLDWRAPPPRKWDVILAADVMYEKRHCETLVALFERILAPGGVVLAADQDRAYKQDFLMALDAGNFMVEEKALLPEIGSTGASTFLAATPCARVKGTLFTIRRRP